MRRLRICQLITELRPGGAERCVYELATRLDRTRFDVRVAALRGGEVADRLREAGVLVWALDLRGKWDLGRLAVLPRLLRGERIDLLHTHLFHADLAGRVAAHVARTPHLIHTVHVAEGRFRPWQFAWARLAAPLCERIVCVSGAVRDRHARASGLPEWRYRVIPNGVDTSARARDPEARARLRGEWGLGADEVVAAFVGRLDRQNGVDVLLAAMDRLADGAGVRWVLAGDGPGREAVQRHVAASGGRAQWLGFRRDVAAVLSAADVFVAPSRWEGLPLATAEAMAAGLPVVAARAPGLEEVVLDGRTGLLVPREDPQALADAIGRLAAAPALRSRLGAAGRDRARCRYDIATNIAAHEALYEEAAAGGTPYNR